MPAAPAPPHPWLVPAVVTGGLAPLAAIALRAARGQLGADPVAIALNQLGLLTLVLLIAALACTPAKIILGWTWPVRVRKSLGLLAFFYGSLHFTTYAVIDQGLRLGPIVEDVVKRPFIAFGFTALVLLAPLAATSTSSAVRRMGYPAWKRLHRLAYVAAALGVVHFWLRVKKDVSEPATYGAILAALLAVRALHALRRRP